MGGDGSAVEKGYTLVKPDMLYNAALGYGWIVAPDAAFDTLNSKQAGALLRDGVVGNTPLVFQADMPDGDYFLSVVAGLHRGDDMLVNISVNDVVVADSVATPWYRLTYKSIRQRVHISGQKAVVTITGLKSGSGVAVGLLSIALRPVNDLRAIDMADGPEEDTSALRSFAHQLALDSTDIAASNQLVQVNKYLLACKYYDYSGWGWAVKETGMNQIQRMYAAADLLDDVLADASDPLRYKAMYLLARIHYWLNQEDDDLMPPDKAIAWFRELSDVYPKHSIIKMYLDNKIKDDFTPAIDNAHAPRWAVLQHEAMGRMLKLIHWWTDVRQADNGELGGKLADDVEMLRWWLPAVLGADDEKARAGYARMADGIWHSNLLLDGYAKAVDDVEHSAELFRDSHPGMFLTQYGDPEYVERCMISMQHFRDVWSGLSPGGHRHFKSYFLSASEALPQAPFGVDVPLNARALLPGLWAAWYNGNPTIMRLFSEWSNAWVADAAGTANGKPAGVFPAAVCFEDHNTSGYSGKWYDPQLKYEYYKWDRLGHACELFYHLTGMYALSGNKHFLEPVNQAAAFIRTARTSGLPADSATEGSLGWAMKVLRDGGRDIVPGAHPLGQVFAMTGRLSGVPGYNDLIADLSSPYNQFLVKGNTNALLDGFDKILGSLRYNFPLLTSEVKFTDRVYVKGSDLLTGMYTGHFGRGFEFPALVATWKHTGPDVSIFVRGGNDSSATISLYNAGKEKEIVMTSWQLAPGSYRVVLGSDLNDDAIADDVLHDTVVTITERIGYIPVRVPSEKEVVLRISRLYAAPVSSAPRADIALHARDIVLPAAALQTDEMVMVQCTVHNIGNAAGKAITVLLLVDGVVVDSSVVKQLRAPNDLVPAKTVVPLRWKATAGKHSLTLKTSMQRKEISVINNEASIRIDVATKNNNAR